MPALPRRAAVAKIYTKLGDDGSTGLFGGPRVRKDDLRVQAYGEIDELNSALGVARCSLTDARVQDLAAFVDSLQSELFNLGAELATPDLDKAPKSVPQTRAQDVERLEREIDRLTAELPPMRFFILPSGAPGAAALHLCRTICRRAERTCVRLAETTHVSPIALAYVNRLSDLLFTLARAANLRVGVAEVPWVAPKP
ncbi:MAG: cob(I)yrinic acid a,c-diamide adenosyltransferase [Deltaproteobacteria bacterium]|nr:cob(I)yrinic acid a,c-diamide adenosyltransferase [Deltaproteobacteria bacterium]